MPAVFQEIDWMGDRMLVVGLSGNFSAEDTDLAPGMADYFCHDAAACVIKDGVLLAAAEEERFNRIKKTTKFPVNAIRACLAKASVSPAEIDAVGHYFREDFIDQALNELYMNYTQLPLRYSRELITERLKSEFDLDLPDDRLIYAHHHDAHALSCFVQSGMQEALVVVMDGQGEEHSITIYRGYRGRLETLATYEINKSLGWLYQRAITLLGYSIGDEYKVMGLAPYGNPATYGELFDALYTLGEDGRYELHRRTLGDHPIAGIFFSNGFLPRRKGEKFTQQHMDFAAGLQQMLEKIAMHVLTYWAKSTGLPNLCFVGGVAHNSSLNGAILRSGMFREVFIHPASHDAGAAEGAALSAAYQLGAGPYSQPRLRSASLGPSLGELPEIEEKLNSWSAVIEFEHAADIVESAAQLLAAGSVLGWAHGASEFGPRALGNRSILADARPSQNKSKINAMVKKREAYRPFAPVVTPEAANTYFDMPATIANHDFMSFVVAVREDRKQELGAVTHVDGSARLQIIDPESNGRFYRLVKRFGELTGTPVLLNTSFNNNAEPIVHTVEDALTCFLTTDIDFLAIEEFLIRRRPGRSLALNDFILEFRPVTRLARYSRLTTTGEREVIHEIYLDYATGPHAEVSPTLFPLLEAADGSRTLSSLGSISGGLSDDIRKDLYKLWQERFFTLRPESA
jgi:decarbamoylnovobiocin carbamoyltransferase/7-O-carbamoyltransferase